MEHTNFGSVFFKVEELSHRRGEMVPERWAVPFARPSRRTGVFDHLRNGIGVGDLEKPDECRKVSDRDTDIAGLDPVDLRARPLERLGDLVLRQASRFARPTKGETKPSTRQRW